uniref:Uncharacterized protein n=1 Tax=Vespula pensylvanica TaxID=30213 RepID=A0A834NRJ3_VESPE|nr:hypothetical protein H0235_012592 [Vespula pensylvanica]
MEVDLEISQAEPEAIKVNLEKAVTSPSIYIDAQIIDPLLKFLDEIARQNNYTIKQLKENQIKIQINSPEAFRKVINVVKIKNAG